MTTISAAEEPVIDESPLGQAAMPPDPTPDILQLPEFRLLLVERFSSALAGVGFATLIGYQLYKMTGDPLALGWLGLIEAIPALSLSLIGGYLADRIDRKNVVLTTITLNIICMVSLALIALNPERFGLLAIYSVVFVIGFAIGFYRPASSAFEQQVVPINQAARGASLSASVWLAGGIAGAPIAGFSIDWLGIPATYLLIAGLMTISAICFILISRKPVPPPIASETIWQSLREGGALCFSSSGVGWFDGAGSLCGALWRRNGAAADLCPRCFACGRQWSRPLAHRPFDWRAACHGGGHPSPAHQRGGTQPPLVCRRLWRQHDRLWAVAKLYGFDDRALL